MTNSKVCYFPKKITCKGETNNNPALTDLVKLKACRHILYILNVNIITTITDL